MNTKLSVMVLVNMRVMMMETGFVKSMSTRWRDSSPSCAPGCVRIVAFLRKSYRCTWFLRVCSQFQERQALLSALLEALLPNSQTPIEPYLNGQLA